MPSASRAVNRGRHGSLCIAAAQSKGPSYCASSVCPVRGTTKVYRNTVSSRSISQTLSSVCCLSGSLCYAGEEIARSSPRRLRRTVRMTTFPEGRAIIYCQGAFGTTTGKTAHGLVRRTRRYEVLAVVDATHAGADAGMVLEGRANGIPLVADLAAALAGAKAAGWPATHFVIGLAPDGGRLDPAGWRAVKEAIEAGLHVDSGLHDFLSEDPELAPLAARKGVQIRDVR